MPLGLIAEKRLTYYRPIVEPDIREGHIVIPQKRGREVRKPIAFRAALRALIEQYPPESLSSFYRQFQSRSLSTDAARCADAAINAIARTIIVGPVKYAGSALDRAVPFFTREGRQTARGRCSTPAGAEAALGKVILPGAVWRELCLIGHWISESILLRWADLTVEISDGQLTVARVLERLMVPPTTSRDVYTARSIYLGLSDLRSVWTDTAVRRESMAVDHVIPFSLWSNNDLWNLLPTSNAVNARKSDRLVGRELLSRRRDSIIHHGEVLRAAQADRFELEVGRALTREQDWSGNSWQTAAFRGLVESVETLALQRGVERWAP